VGAVDLLQHLRAVGIRIVVEGALLRVTPADRLTDDMRAAIRAHKPDLLALLAQRGRPHKLTKSEADAAINRFVARVGLFLRRGLNATDANDVAERLHLRDNQIDDRRQCLECRHLSGNRSTGWRCAVPEASGFGPGLLRDLALCLQRCPEFDEPGLVCLRDPIADSHLQDRVSAGKRLSRATSRRSLELSAAA
jgi:hypothetical protein